jgi:hypothetical protein
MYEASEKAKAKANERVLPKWMEKAGKKRGKTVASEKKIAQALKEYAEKKQKPAVKPVWIPPQELLQQGQGQKRKAKGIFASKVIKKKHKAEQRGQKRKAKGLFPRKVAKKHKDNDQ